MLFVISECLFLFLKIKGSLNDIEIYFWMDLFLLLETGIFMDQFD